MAFEITIPRLGWSMEEGTFVRWLKKDGDSIQAGDAVFELEGEKAAQDVEAVDSGFLRIPSNAPSPGSIVAVGTVIGFLVAEGEETPVVPTPAAASTIASKSQGGQKANPSLHVSAPDTLSPHVSPAASPSVRRMAREKGIKLGSVQGSGPAGRIMADDVLTATAQVPVHPQGTDSARIASPRARRIAGELGIDWRRLSGTGRGGRVRERDVRQAVARIGADRESSIVNISSRRRTIANRMQASCSQTAPVTLTTKLDATNLVNLRNQFKQSENGTVVPSYSDIIIKLVASVLQQHPMLAARDEDGHWEIPTSPDDLHIGFAVDTEDGLVVPVVRHAGVLGLFEIAKYSLALIDKSRSGRLTITEMQGGVFTITNLGSFGIDAFTPIINLPETAVLGLGRIRREPAVIDNQVVVRDQITLSLTFDHRVVDGAPAARFLQTLSQAIENPSAWLLRDNG